MHEAICIMATFTDDIYDNVTSAKPPPVLKCFIEQRIPFKENFRFNNKDIYTKPVDTTSFKGQIETSFWDMSTKSFRSFFDILEATIPISLTLTKKFFKRNNIINAKLPHIIRNIKIYFHEIEELEQDKRIIEEMIADPKAPDYNREIEVVRIVMVDIDEPNCYATWCNNCNVVCHYPCYINKDNAITKSILWCSAMTWFNPFNVHCTACPGKCDWKDHKQIREKQIFVTTKISVTIDKLKQRYMQDINYAKKHVKTKSQHHMINYKRILKK